MNKLFNDEPAGNEPTTPAAPAVPATFEPFTCSDADFNTSAIKYRKELIMAPVRRLWERIGNLVTIRPGIRYAEKQLGFDLDVEFGNYDPLYEVEAEPEVKARTLHTYFGSTPVMHFDPNMMYRTMLGSDITLGEGLKNTEIVRLMLNVMSGKLGDTLFKNLFSAKHEDGAHTSAKLFNGYDTICTEEITAGNLATAKGNLYEFAAAITNENAVDSLKAFCLAADDYLMDRELNLLVPRNVYHAYLEDYKATTGAIPYNREYKQVHVEGFDNVTLRPMSNKKNSPYLQLTHKANTLVGVNQVGNEEKVVVEKHHVVMLDFFATIFFGVDFASIDKEHLLVGKLHA